MANMNEIEPGLWMGGAITIRPAQIQAIMDMQIEHEDVLSPSGLHSFCWMPIADVPSAAPGVHWIDNCVNIVIGWRNVGWNVLIHCKSGHSRSGMITVAYIMKTRNMTRDAALAFVRQSRPSCAPNPGFMESLLSYQAFLGITGERDTGPQPTGGDASISAQ